MQVASGSQSWLLAEHSSISATIKIYELENAWCIMCNDVNDMVFLII